MGSGKGIWALVVGVGTLAVASAVSTGRGDALNRTELDKYGGCSGVSVPGGGTGFFRTQKVADRWVFVTPAGNPFWMLAVYSIGPMDGGKLYGQALKQKYEGAPSGFVVQAVRRLRSWGFNAIGEYSTEYVLPVGTYGRKDGNPEKIPFIRMIRPSGYGTKPKIGVKELISGVDPTIYTGWRGAFPDLFDPKFEAFAAATASDQIKQFTQPLDDTPWLIGTTTDDGDDLTGFGPGPEAHLAKVHPHLGWIVAVTAPTQKDNPKLKVTYDDATVHTKIAWRDFLIKKYKSVASLNSAWGAHYTTWDSDGGWPNGAGLLDESGRHPWIGNDYQRLSGASKGAAADMDEFLGILAGRYFSVVSQAVRSATPHHLVFGPASISAGARPQILEAAGRYLDVLQVYSPPDRLDLIANAYTRSGKPVFVWSTLTSQADFDLASANVKGWPHYDFPSQEGRGRAYATYVNGLFNLQATDGIYPVAGIDWWEWVDKIVGGEKMNFGLVSVHDDAYDGKEDKISQAKDEWSYVTGGEQKDHGDFLSTVRETNVGITTHLSTFLRPAASENRSIRNCVSPPPAFSKAR